MLAAVIRDKTLRLEERPLPVPGPGEALLRTVLAGVCNTDLELLKGYYNFTGIPGHEFVAVVEKAPDHPALEGRRVAGDINLGCGKCPLCRAGDARHCPDRTTLGILGKDGVFATHFTLPVGNLRPIPDNLADEKAVFAEPLAAALEVGQQLHLTARHRLAVLGDGKLGLLVALGLRHHNPNITLYGRHPEKLSLAERFGVTTALHDPAQAPRTYDIVVEATGRPEGLEAALNLVRPEGTVVCKTTTEAKTGLNMARVVVDEITLMGSRCGDIALALHALAEGLVDPTGLIEATLPFCQVTEAFERAGSRGAKKVLVRF
ncbi:alcohol dehydrogenase catalytic domain-containing protein [Fundidesulfovibrio butyratiphilus]